MKRTLSPYLQFGRYAGPLPAAAKKRLRAVFALPTRTRSDIRRLLLVLRKIVFSRPRRTNTRNFQQSRFISVTDIWRRNQVSCGSLTTLVASALRTKGVPVKLIDGWLGEKAEARRHAWNEVYIVSEQRWVSFDITRKSLRVGKRHRRKKAWPDWSDMQKVYRSG